MPENACSSCYTPLIFSDVLIVLISLRYSAHYLVSFRNSGYAVATALMALIAPIAISAAGGGGDHSVCPGHQPCLQQSLRPPPDDTSEGKAVRL